VRSIGHEETFSHDRYGLSELRAELVRLCDSVAGRIRANHCAARTVSVKVRFGDFTTITRSVTVPAPIDTAPAVLRACDELLAQVPLDRGIRLLGVSGSNLVADARQLSLDDLTSGAAEAAAAIDEIRRRFGSGAIGSAAAVSGRVSSPGTSPWGPARSDEQRPAATGPRTGHDGG
jgi:DNA polymerase-4